MKISDKGLMALIGSEGIVQSRYRDAVGVWTIGVGHTAAAGAPDPEKFSGAMPIREVFDLLRRDVAKYEAAVSKAVKVALEQHEFDALVSWHYNTGRISRASFLADLNSGRKRAAGEKLQNAIVTAKGKRLQALVDRRKAESAMFLDKRYPKPVATLFPATPQGKVLWGQGRTVDLVRALQIAEKPPQTPAGAQEPQKAPEPPAKPADAAPGAIVAVGAGGVLAALGADNPLFWVGVAMAAAAIGVVIWSVVKRRRK